MQSDYEFVMAQILLQLPYVRYGGIGRYCECGAQQNQYGQRMLEPGQ